MKNKTIEDYLAHHEKTLHELIENADIPATRIREAITYALFPGGKRLRPLLVYLCGDLIGANPACLETIAASIELTHCYSLVHDDLPAMDDDDFRRGRPSCHRAFDEATAILAGDAMQILAIDVLLDALPPLLGDQKTIRVTQALVKASGPSGMVSGQSLDLSELTKPELSETELKSIHMLKTGQLISACIHMVLAAGEPTPSATQALDQFARHLGLVFQMQDDYLDRYDHEKQLGKGRASDAANQKTTYATLYTQDQLAELISLHFEKASDCLNIFKERALDLLELVNQLRHRL